MSWECHSYCFGAGEENMNTVQVLRGAVTLDAVDCYVRPTASRWTGPRGGLRPLVGLARCARGGRTGGSSWRFG